MKSIVSYPNRGDGGRNTYRVKKVEIKMNNKNYFLRFVGTDKEEKSEFMSEEQAVQLLQSEYYRLLENHPGKYVDADLDENTRSFSISDDNYYQWAMVFCENSGTDMRSLLEEIRRNTILADAYTAKYQYDLIDCGVYDFTYEIRRLVEKLESSLNE